MRICFVCLGNICRSPTAEAVMRKLVDDAGLIEKIHIESAGTGDWHVGEPPDGRSRQVAKKRGFSVQGRAQQFTARDFARFDVVLAMDGANRRALEEMAPSGQERSKVVLFRSFDAGAPKNADVPDPYYGGPDGFDTVLDICEAACRGLLEHLQTRLEP